MGMNDKHDYDPTKWVDNSEPDIDAEHLNKIESALQEYGVSIDELAATGGTAAKVKATDTYGMVVEALGESTAQALIDAIANKVMNELINKNKIVNNLLATDASTVLAGTQGAALDKRLVAAENAVTQLNSEVIGSLTPSNEVTSVSSGIWRKSNVISVAISFKPVKELPAGSYDLINIGTLPSEFAPKAGIMVIFRAQASNLIFNGCLSHDGKLDLWCWGGVAITQSMNMSSSFTYVMK